jgi:hypothetical protein
MQLVVKEYEGVPFKVWRCGVVVGV